MPVDSGLSGDLGPGERDRVLRSGLGRSTAEDRETDQPGKAGEQGAFHCWKLPGAEAARRGEWPTTVVAGRP